MEYLGWVAWYTSYALERFELARAKRKMKLGEESDEDCWDDPIRLFDNDSTGVASDTNSQEQRAYTTNGLQAEATTNEYLCQAKDDSSSAETEAVAELSPRGNLNLDVPGSFVKLVDCGKFPWYYKKYAQQILNLTTEKAESDREINVIDSDSDLDDCVIVEDNLPNKIKTVQTISVFRTKIKFKSTIEKRRETMKRKEELELKRALDLKNKMCVDLKRNTGLIGMKIARKTELSGTSVDRNNAVNKAKVDNKQEDSTADDKQIKAAEKILSGAGTQPTPPSNTTDINNIKDKAVKEKQATNPIIISKGSLNNVPNKLLAQCRLDRISNHLLNKIKTMKNNNLLLKAKIQQMQQSRTVAKSIENAPNTATRTQSNASTEKPTTAPPVTSAITISKSDISVPMNSSSHVKDISKTKKFKNDQMKLQNNDEFNNFMKLISPNAAQVSATSKIVEKEKKNKVKYSKETKKVEPAEKTNLVKSQKRNLNSPILPCRVLPKKSKESNDIPTVSSQSDVSLNTCKNSNLNIVVNKLMNTENLKIQFKGDHTKMDLSKKHNVITSPSKQMIEENIYKNKINKKDLTVTKCVDTDFKNIDLTKPYKPTPNNKQTLPSNKNEKLQKIDKRKINRQNNVSLQHVADVIYSESYKSNTSSNKTPTKKPTPKAKALKLANASNLGKPVSSQRATKSLADNIKNINPRNENRDNTNSTQNRYASSIILKPNQQASAPNIGYSDIRKDSNGHASTNLPIPVVTDNRNENVYGYHQTAYSGNYAEYLSRSKFSGAQNPLSQDPRATTSSERQVIYNSTYSQNFGAPLSGYFPSSAYATPTQIAGQLPAHEIHPPMPTGPPQMGAIPSTTTSLNTPTSLAPITSNAVSLSKASGPSSVVGACPQMPITRPPINSSQPHTPAVYPPTTGACPSMPIIRPPINGSHPSMASARPPMNCTRLSTPVVRPPMFGARSSIPAVWPPTPTNRASMPKMNNNYQPPMSGVGPTPVSAPVNTVHPSMSTAPPPVSTGYNTTIRQPTPAPRQPVPVSRHSMSTTNFRPPMSTVGSSINADHPCLGAAYHPTTTAGALMLPPPMNSTHPAMNIARQPVPASRNLTPVSRHSMSITNFRPPMSAVGPPMNVAHPHTGAVFQSTSGAGAPMPHMTSSHPVKNAIRQPAPASRHPSPEPRYSLSRYAAANFRPPVSVVGPSMNVAHHSKLSSHPLIYGPHPPTSVNNSTVLVTSTTDSTQNTVHYSIISSQPLTTAAHASMSVADPFNSSMNSSMNAACKDFLTQPVPMSNVCPPTNAAHPSISAPRPFLPVVRPTILGSRLPLQTIRPPSMPVRPPTVTMPTPSAATTVLSFPTPAGAVSPPRFPVPQSMLAHNSALLAPHIPPLNLSQKPINNNDLANNTPLDAYRNIPVTSNVPVPPQIYSNLSQPADSSIIGINNDHGVVKKINIASKPATNTAEVTVKVEPVNDSQIETSQNDATVVKTKKEMMKELDRLSFSDEDTPLDVLKQMKQNEALKKTSTENKNNVNNLDVKAAPKEVVLKSGRSKGYSNPILPIPTYEKVLDQVMAGSQMLHEKIIRTLHYEDKKKEQELKRDAAKKEKGNKRKLSQVINRLGESKKLDAKKISLEEYKKRGVSKSNNSRHVKKGNAKAKNDNRRRQAEVNMDSTETDLGYDSDSTVIL